MFVELEGRQFTLVAGTQPVQRLKGMIHRPKTAVSIEELGREVRKAATLQCLGGQFGLRVLEHLSIFAVLHWIHPSFLAD